MAAKRIFWIVGSLIICLAIFSCAEETPEQQLSAAELLIADGNNASAIVKLKAMLQKSPDNPQALRLIGLAHYQAAQYEEAVQKLGRLISSPDIDDRTVVAYSSAQVRLQNYQTALEAITSRPFADDMVAETTAIHVEAMLGLGRIGQAHELCSEALDSYPNNTSLLLALSKIYLRQGKRYLSIKTAREALEIEPGNPQIYDHLGSILFDQQMFQEAAESFLAALDQQDNQPLRHEVETQFKLLRSYVATDQAKEAQVILESIREKAPGHPAISYFSALLLFDDGQLEAALTAALELLAKVKKHPPTDLLVGVISYRLGKLEQANMYLQRFLSSQPERVSARKLLASTQLRLDNPEAATATLRQGLEYSPDDLSLSELIGEIETVSTTASRASNNDLDVSNEASLLTALVARLENRDQARVPDELRRIMAVAKSGQTEQAHRELLRLLEHHPDNPYLLEFAGILASVNGNIEEADSYWLHALETEPRAVESAINLVNVHSKNGTPDEARELLVGLLAKDSSHLGALLGLAALAEMNGNPTEAEANLRSAIQTNQNELEPHKRLIHFLRKHQQPESAEKALRNALASLPGQPGLQLMLAQQLVVKKQPEKAIKILESLLSGDPMNVELLYNYSLALISNNQATAALPPLNQAFDLSPESYKTASRLASILARDGSADDALDIASRYKKASGDNFGFEVLQGLIWSETKNYAKAADHYANARSLKPSEPVLLMEVSAREKGGDRNSAIKLTQEWLSEYPEHQQTRFELATLQLFSNRYIDSALNYSALLEAGGHLATVYNNLAWLYQQLDDNRALEIAELGQKRYPDDALMKDTLGWILASSNQQLDRAEKLLNESYEETRHPSIGYHLAYTLVKNNKKNEAQILLKKLLLLEENFPEKELALELSKTFAN